MSLKSLLRTLLRQKKYLSFTSIAARSENYEHSEDNRAGREYGKAFTAALFSSVLVGAVITDKLDTQQTVNRDKSHKAEDVTLEAGQKRADLPTYRAEEVSKHDSKNSFWVTYKHGVYDVTAFLPAHPGGEQILNAAGLSIEPFWNVYGMHKTREVYTLLESYRIGNLHDDDIVDHSDEEMWASEPRRDARLVVRTARPFNAEVPRDQQAAHFDTPNELFYVRQHMPVPELDADTHTLRVTVKPSPKGTPGVTPGVTEFSLRDLDKFERVEVRAALMCAGNRRSEMDKVKPVKGISWTGGAVSNAVWGGVFLRDLLLSSGVDPRDTAGKHVILMGADMDATGTNFSTSIPLHMALDPNQRVLLATHMNGVALPPDHGYPLRAVVPGAPAVRSVKWLESITVSEDESPSHWHQKDYRSFNASKTWETADFSTAPPVYSLPVTSAVCAPGDGDTARVRGGCVELRGYAYSGGGASILRVDVSTDGGQSWTEAQELQRDAAPPPRHHSWALWTARVPVEKQQREVEVWVKATDSNFNTQPERFDHIWNIRGILSNAYHRVTIKLQH